ncbi:MAG: flagellar filament capping protein FliD [Nitrospirae bacterium]|nr:flagellar filament capping protein FliD [Nitrospirota bacterium]
MSSFTVGGLSTGVDYNELIGKLIEAQRQPITILENKKTSYNNKISSYSELSTKLSTLKSAADKLKYSYNFYVKTSSVSDETVLDATPSGITSVGNYSVSVTTLASEEKEAHSGVASSSTVINNSGSNKVFQYTYAGTQRSITVATGTTLDGLKNLINDDTGNPGVTATVVSDGTNSRLIITGDDSGSTKTISIDAGTTLDGTGSTSDFRSSTFTQTKAAANAAFTVDNLSITRSSNTFSDVIEGMTITLKKQGGVSSNISVSNDTSAIKEQINDFVDAYNEIAEFLSTNMAYDSVTGISGVLSGEGTARNIQHRLRGIISDEVSGLSGDLTLLAQIGITTDSETGKLEVNGTTLDSKLGSYIDDIADLFKSSDGVATSIYDYITEITSTVDGSITLRKDGLSDIIENIDDTITRMEFRLDKTEDDMMRKFTSLEMLVSNFNTVGNYLTNFSTTA